MKTSLDFEIEQLIQKLQKEVEEEGIGPDEDSFWEEDSGAGEKQMEDHRIFIPDPQLHYDHPLHSSKKSIDKLVIFVKRLIRKCGRFLIVPILDEQSSINYSMKAEIDRLNKMIELQEQKIKELEQCRKELP